MHRDDTPTTYFISWLEGVRQMFLILSWFDSQPLGYIRGLSEIQNTVNDYYGFPESIVDEADGESWLGTTAENLLLYGCLVEAYTFMKGSTDLLQAYKQKFDEAVQAFNQTTLYSWDQKR